MCSRCPHGGGGLRAPPRPHSSQSEGRGRWLLGCDAKKHRPQKTQRSQTASNVRQHPRTRAQSEGPRGTRGHSETRHPRGSNPELRKNSLTSTRKPKTPSKPAEHSSGLSSEDTETANKLVKRCSIPVTTGKGERNHSESPPHPRGGYCENRCG